MPDSDVAAVGTGRRLHPLTAVTTGLVFAVPVTVGLLGSALQGGGLRDLPGWAVPVVVLGSVLGGFVVGTVGGYVSWRSTTYVIDGTEVRVESGVLTKASRRIPYERLQSVGIAQPLVARALGLAELRLEMAGGSESSTRLRYLRLAEAHALRRVLLARAHGSPADEATGTAADDDRRVLARVGPGRLVLGTLLSLDFALAVAAGVVLLAAVLWFGNLLALLGGVLPVLTWIGQMVGRRVVAQWDFTLSEGDTGLRIERGLLSRTSQTVPLDRVQGVALVEPLVWRRLGWVRLEVDVAGYAGSAEDGTGTTSTLLPIADPALAASLLERLVPGAEAAPPVRTVASPRSRVLAPVGWSRRWVADGPTAFVAGEGWVERTTSVVPHGRTQSVELRQGPLQRRLGVATVEVHSPEGPVDADGRHLAAADARDVALAQLARARAARR